jgi:hypothetical protein
VAIAPLGAAHAAFVRLILPALLAFNHNAIVGKLHLQVFFLHAGEFGRNIKRMIVLADLHRKMDSRS